MSETPAQTETSQEPHAPEEDEPVESQELSTRIILLSDVIDFEATDIVSQYLEAFTRESEEYPIEIRISSHGGSYACGMAIVDLLNSADCTIITSAYGRADSAAGLVFQAGDVRRIAENARMLLHSVRVHMGDQMITLAGANELTADLEESQKRADRIFSERTGQSLQQIREWVTEEKLFTAEQALDAHLADEIIKTPLGRKRFRRERLPK